MLRSLLFLSFSLSSLAFASERIDHHLPRLGQTVDLFNGDLSKNIGQVTPGILHTSSLYTIQHKNLPTMHFLPEEERFSIPGVVATDRAQKFDEQGAIRWVYRGFSHAGSIEKNAQIELVKFDEGRCQLSWKFSVLNHERKLRNEQGSMAYDCRDKAVKSSNRAALRILPQYLLDR